jgi:hypothetical protein
MKKLTTNLMIATAALVVVAGVASAQTLTVSIPFEFRAGNRVMAPGTYFVNDLGLRAGTPLYRILSMNSHQATLLTPQVPVDPEQAWRASGGAKLVFACVSGSCDLAEIWDGARSNAYTLSRPKLGKGEDAYLREIPMQRGKGE